jgi:hypothetical protein
MKQNVTLDRETAISFWYYMYGLQIGSLSLILDDVNILWKKIGRQQNEWSFATVNLPAGEHKVNYSFRIYNFLFNKLDILGFMFFFKA